MDASRYLERITDDESLTDGLTDDQAVPLVDWAVARAERLLAGAASEADADRIVAQLRARARAVSQAVQKICDESDPSAAAKLLGPSFSEAWCQGLPADDPSAVLEQILHRETGNEK